MGVFGKYEGPGWHPYYGDVDWKRRQELLIDEGELDLYKQVGFDSKDGLVVECSQENLAIRLNRVAPHMDMIAQSDYRDDRDYIWFRDQDPDKFHNLVEKLGRAALVITTEFPLPDTVRIYLDRQSLGMNTLDD